MSSSISLVAKKNGERIDLFVTGAYPGGTYIIKVWVNDETRNLLTSFAAGDDGSYTYLGYPGEEQTGVPDNILSFAVYSISNHRVSNIAKVTYPSNGNGSTNGKACLLTALSVPFVVLELIRHFIRPILPLAVTKKYYSLSARILLPNS